MNNYPKLYKKTSTGALQEWSISVLDKGKHALIVTSYGQVGGKTTTII